MERIDYLKLKIRKYLLQRKIFRTVEFSASFVVVVLLFAFDEEFRNIIACVAGLLLIPESLLSVHRSEIKSLIKDENLIAKKEIEFYSWIKSEFEKMRDEFISQGSMKFVSDECKKLVWKEEMGTGWLSVKVYESESKCDDARQTIEQLKSLKRLVIF